MDDAYGDPRNYDPNDPYFDPNSVDPTQGAPPVTSPWPNGIPPNGGNQAGYMDLSYWQSRGVTPDQIFDENGQPRPGWARTGNGYEHTGGGTTQPPPRPTDTYPTNDNPFTLGAAPNPNAGFSWPTYNGQRFGFDPFSGFDPFVQPTQEDITNDPVLNAQLTEGQSRLKSDRAFRGVLNTGGTLKDIFDWTADRVKLGANDIFDRKFKTWDANNQAKFQTWGANRDLAFGAFDRNSNVGRDEFVFNQYEPAKATFDDNYRRWKAQGDWISGVDPT